MPGFKDPFYSVILQYIDEQKLEGNDVDDVMKIAGVLRRLAGEGNLPDFGSHSLSSIEYFLGEEISSTGRKMLQEKFKIAINPFWNVIESGMELINDSLPTLLLNNHWLGLK